MTKKTTLLLLLILSGFLLFTGCSDDDNSSSGTPTEEEHDDHEYMDDHDEHEDERYLFFYSASTNDHYAYSLHDKKLIDLNGEDYALFNVGSEENGRPFIWLDNKGDEDESNDEQKIIMLRDSYSFDRNLTWEDFIYLGHYHYDENSSELAAHSNSEFNVTAGKKVEALNRINSYIAEQNDLKESFGGDSVCGVLTAHLHHDDHEEEDHDHEEEEEVHYVMGIDGTLKVYNEEKNIIDSVVIGASCQSDRFGMSATDHGVSIYLADSGEIYEVDSHDDGVYHIHSRIDVSDYIGGADAEFMVSIEPVE